MCHTAVADTTKYTNTSDTNSIVYSASSPDEKALVEACRYSQVSL